jgi:hypothetical protein
MISSTETKGQAMNTLMFLTLIAAPLPLWIALLRQVRK